jgi:hypothetical protein
MSKGRVTASVGKWMVEVIVVLVLGSSVALSQLTTGTIVGTVTDQSGGAVPGVTITIKNLGTGAARSTETGVTGRYEALNLAVGSYEVSASMPGFQTSIQSGIELTVGRAAVVNVTLQVGEVTQSVTITGEVATVETTTATVSSLISEEQVLDLPLNNRDLTQLAYLQPGVIKVPRSGGSIHSGMGETISVGGMRGTQNQYLLDGVSNTDISGNPQGASGAYTGAETIQEFQVITNNYSAEYRSTAGAIVSAITKSGTNTLSGSLFEFLRNDNLDANRWEENKFGRTQPEFKRNQFGGSVGGPIVRDRTFFFGSYEGLRERQSETELIRVPDMDARAGRLPTLQGGTCLAPAPVTFSAVMAPYLALFPVPGQGNTIVPATGAPRCDGTVELSGVNKKQVNEDFASGRFNHHFAGQRAGILNGSYSFTKSHRQSYGLLGGVAQSSERETNDRHVLSTGHTSVITPTILNQFNFGYVSSQPGKNGLTDRDWSALKFAPFTELMGSLSVGDGVTPIGFNHSEWRFRQRNYMFKDDLSIAHGNHSYRIGIDIDLRRINHFAGSEGANGDYEFANLRDFLANRPDVFISQISDDPKFQERNIRQMLFGVYFQDNWDVRPALTLNLGLRYEFAGLPTERDDKLTALVDFVRDSAADMKTGVMYRQATLKSFSPRVGFAWAPGSGRTSVRAGAGIYYDFPGYHHYRQHLSSTPPFATVARLEQRVLQTLGTNLVFPNAFTTHRSLLEGGGQLQFWGMDYNQENATVYRWSLNLQHELPGAWLISAGYTGTRATHLITQAIPNVNRWQGWPAAPASGPRFWPTISGTNPINPNWTARTRVHSSFGNSFYQGLSLDGIKRLSYGFQLQMTYTYAKSIDEGSGLSSGDNLYGTVRTNYWDPLMNRGLSQFDLRHNFATNFTYNIPLAENLTGMAGALAKGWQVNGIVSVSSGFPLTLEDGGPNRARRDPIGANDFMRPNLIPNGDQNPVLGGPDQYFDPSQFVPSYCSGSRVCFSGEPDYRPGYYGNLGRNTLISPGLATFDFSIAKNTPLTEQKRIQFRTEIFNLFNRPNFGPPLLAPFLSSGQRDANVGRIEDTRTSARQIQFGLKFLF